MSCRVCEQPATSTHFGVVTCRACAMYFRRIVSQKRQLEIKCDQRCRIDKFTRKICRSCRYEKCVKAGMRGGDSQKFGVEFQPGPLLISLKKGFKNLEAARMKAFGITENKISSPSTYTTQNVVITIDCKLIINHFISEIHTFHELSKNDQNTILSQFIAPFHILESTYKSTEPDFVILANGDHIDHNGLHKYYENLIDSHHQLAFRVFKPYWDRHHRIIRSGLDDVNLDENEFLFLLALMIWDIDFHEIDEELLEKCLQQKEKIMKELCEYVKYRESLSELREDRSIRVGRIVMLLQVMQKTLNMLWESHEVSQLYRIDTVHDTFFDLLKTKF